MLSAAALLLLCSASGFAPPRSPLLGAPLLRNAAVRKFAPVAVASADDAPPADTSPLPPSLPPLSLLVRRCLRPSAWPLPTG